MENKKRNKGIGIILCIIVLGVCIAATSIALMDRLNVYLLNDKGAIALDLGTLISKNELEKIKDKFNSIKIIIEEHTENDNEKTKEENGSVEKKASFEVLDDNQVWGTDTEVEIFKVTYSNDKEIITVQSDNEEKVIAPGTSNSYTFKLKNTGEVAIDYIVDVDAYITPGEITIPIDTRLVRYDGKWIVGDIDSFDTVEELDIAEDQGTLGAGRYGYYTLDWAWPFESGNDIHDTMLGDMAAEGEDITFTIEIHTVATRGRNPDATDGLLSIQTGDQANLPVLITATVGAVVILFILIVLRKKESTKSKE